MNYFGPTLVSILRGGAPDADLVAVDNALARLTCVKTPGEIDRIRGACRIAENAFRVGYQELRAGLAETRAAAAFRNHLSTRDHNQGPIRADGFVFCMSGPNAATAGAAYARSRERLLARGDFVLVHCNSYLNGYWTDITRTYTLGPPDARQRQIYEAIFEARQAALEAIQPGVKAASVDRAARSVLESHGFGLNFTHSTGHGVGFSAISPHAEPQIHPQSRQPLAPGMVFNIEPAVYLQGYGGVRHCDMVAVTDTAYELLTPFQTTAAELELPV
jgi:Xaa-Pro aminopeptidase